MLPIEMEHYWHLNKTKAELDEVESILCDGSYSGKPFANSVKALLGERVTVQ